MRTSIGLVLALAILTGCTAQPVATVPTDGPTAAPATPTPTGSPSPASASPSSAVATFPASTPTAGVPVGIDRVAWVGARREGTDDAAVWHVLAGLLNHQATVRVDVNDGDPHVATAGDVVGIASVGERSTHISVHRATDGTELGSIELDGATLGEIEIDPAHEVVYVAVALRAGGAAIHRLAFDGSRDEVLVTLDKRFTPDGIPDERFDMTLDPDGVLVVEACGETDGCRLWEIPPTATRASAPRTLPGHPPIVCYMAGVTRDWIVVADDDVCFADTGDARLPIRAIRRANGVSHLITDDHVAIGRVLEVGDTVVAVGARGRGAGFPVDVVSYGVITGKPTILVSEIEPGPDDVWLGVSSSVLPSPWVLLEAGFVESAALPSIPARIVNLRTRESIELPLGTSGWS